jgi:hypothetical protein
MSALRKRLDRTEAALGSRVGVPAFVTYAGETARLYFWTGRVTEVDRVVAAASLARTPMATKAYLGLDVERV